MVDSNFNSEQLLLPVPAREFELPFKKIWVSWVGAIRKHTSKEIITADLLISAGKFINSSPIFQYIGILNNLSLRSNS